MKLSDRIGRRIKLHDLHVLLAVVQAGSMGKAAMSLGTTQPAISKSVADLEHAVGVRLLDRTQQGVEPTAYGRTLIEGGVAVFDDLRQALKKIEFQADPTIGQVAVGGNEITIAVLLPHVIERLHQQHSGISAQVTPVVAITHQYRELRERKVDLILGPIPAAIDDDIQVEVLYHDRSIVVAAPNSRWARRRKLALSDLAHEPWILPPPDILGRMPHAQVFREHGIEFPPKGSVLGPFILLSPLISSGTFIGTCPRSVMRLAANVPPLKILPVTLPMPQWPVGIMTLKNRVLNPVTTLLIESARQIVKPLV